MAAGGRVWPALVALGVAIGAWAALLALLRAPDAGPPQHAGEVPRAESGTAHPAPAADAGPASDAIELDVWRLLLGERAGDAPAGWAVSPLDDAMNPILVRMRDDEERRKALEEIAREDIDTAIRMLCTTWYSRLFVPEIASHLHNRPFGMRGWVHAIWKDPRTQRLRAAIESATPAERRALQEKLTHAVQGLIDGAFTPAERGLPVSPSSPGASLGLPLLLAATDSRGETLATLAALAQAQEQALWDGLPASLQAEVARSASHRVDNELTKPLAAAMDTALENRYAALHRAPGDLPQTAVDALHAYRAAKDAIASVVDAWNDANPPSEYSPYPEPGERTWMDRFHDYESTVWNEAPLSGIVEGSYPNDSFESFQREIARLVAFAE